MYIKNNFAFSLQLSPTDHGMLVSFESGYTVLHMCLGLQHEEIEIF